MAVLPSGYIKLQSIRSTGSQYIALACKADSGLAVTVELCSNSTSGAIFGARDASNTIGVYRNGNVSGYARYGSRYCSFSNFPSSFSQRYRVYVSNSQATVNNFSPTGRVDYSISPSTFATNLQLYLLAENLNGTVQNQHAAELFSVIIDNGLPFIPCLNPTGVPGLYDPNTGKFYASASATDFVAGPAVTTSLPSTYTKTDYIEATGTQYIDTGYVPNSTTRVVLDFESTGADFGCLFGARTSSNSGDSKNTFGMWVQDATAFPHYGDGVYNQKPITKPVNTRLTIDMNGATTTIGDTSVTFDSATFGSGCNLTLFGMNTMGNIDSRRAVGKLYGAKIYSGSTLMRDFVPCINPSGVAGLWDKLTGAFYSSAEGAFTVGKNHRVLIDGTGYEVKSGRVLIAGTGYDIKKGRTLIDGTGYDVAFAIPLEALPAGTLVKLNENGSPIEFYVAKHNYETRLNGNGRTLLVRKTAATTSAFDNDNFQFIYVNGSIAYRWLNNTYLSRFDAATKTAIGTTKFKYITSIGASSGVSDTVINDECAIFLLAISEVGGVSNQYTAEEGELLPIASTLKQLGGWSRSGAGVGGRLVGYTLSSTGWSTAGENKYSLYPCFTYPSTALVDSDFNIIPS